jgi:hypothetical protein
MNRRKLLPFGILVLPILFIFLGISYHDSFYFILFGISLIFSIIFAVPSLWANKRLHFRFPKFRYKARRASKILLEGIGSQHIAIKKIDFRDLKTWGTFLVQNPFSLPFFGLLFLFTYLSVFKLPLFSPSKNLFINYYASYFQFIKTDALFVLFSLGVVLVILFLIRNAGMKRFQFSKYPKSKLNTLVISIVILLVTFNLSIGSTFLFGIVEANLLAAKIKINPESAGIIWGKDKILKKLKSMDHPPKITEGGNNLNAKVILIESENNNSRGKYYTDVILKQLPSNLIIPLGIPNEPLVMSNNNLIINSVDKDQMETISPILGKLLVKNYFKNRFIKDEPTLQVLGRQDYLKFREDQINSTLAEVDKYIQAVKDVISSIYGSIAYDKQRIAANQDGLDSSISLRDSAYNDCINNGYYFYGYFYHTFSQSYCDNLKARWDAIIAGYQKNISDWQAQLDADQAELSQYQEAQTKLQFYRDLVASQKDITPQELGVFLPENKTIKIALDYTSPKSVMEYIETLTHEYLHYTSYVSDERSLPQFFEEGLTEYYARKAVRQATGENTNFGYPLLVKIIQQMVSKIPESTLQEIYFNKDKKQLERVLDDSYGKDFYKDSQYYFAIITFVPPKDALKIANNIMVKIGGKLLNEGDLESTMLEIN